MHHKDWADRLLEALWAYRTMWRNTTGHTPYQLVYGKQVLLPIEFQVKTFRTAAQLSLSLDDAQEQRLMQLNKLDEIRQDAVQRTDLISNQRTKWHDKFLKKVIGLCCLTHGLNTSKVSLPLNGWDHMKL